MKVLLVQSHLGRSQRNFSLFPLGLCYVATALKQHTVKILDLNFWEFAVYWLLRVLASAGQVKIAVESVSPLTLITRASGQLAAR